MVKSCKEDNNSVINAMQEVRVRLRVITMWPEPFILVRTKAQSVIFVFKEPFDTVNHPVQNTDRFMWSIRDLINGLPSYNYFRIPWWIYDFLLAPFINEIRL